MDNKNEKQFWGKVFAETNPGWKVALSKDMKPGQVSECATFMYVVDAKTGWITAAATHSKGFQAIKDALPSIVERTGHTIGQVASIAAGWAAKAGKEQALPDSDAALQAINGVSIALAGTNTFDIVKKNTGGVEGHWIYIVYSMMDQSLIGRPLYIGEPRNRFLDTETMHFMISTAIERDLGNPQSAVGKMIVDAGGIDLHDSLQPQQASPNSNPRPQG